MSKQKKENDTMWLFEKIILILFSGCLAVVLMGLDHEKLKLTIIVGAVGWALIYFSSNDNNPKP